MFISREFWHTWARLGFHKSGKVEMDYFNTVLYVFLKMRFGCRSLILGHVGAIMGHSWEDLGVIWGLVGANLCHVGVILRLSWENLGATWLHLGFISLAKWKLLILARFYSGFCTCFWVHKSHLELRWGYHGALLGGLGRYLGAR